MIGATLLFLYQYLSISFMRDKIYLAVSNVISTNLLTVRNLVNYIKLRNSNTSNYIKISYSQYPLYTFCHVAFNYLHRTPYDERSYSTRT